jgi:uncharacterized glyoxalase superfamily protein PhnB
MKRDPLEQLKLADEALDPRPEFADELHERIRRGLEVLLVPLTSQAKEDPFMQTIGVGVPYTDMGRAIRWLTQIFGIKVVKYWGPEDNPMFAYLAWRDGNIFSIAVRPPSDNPWSAVGPVSIGLLEPDEAEIERAYERAVAAGADVVRELQRSSNPAVPDGYLGFTLRDPEGNLWDMQSVSGYELLTP